MYACIYVYMYICIYVCIHIYEYIYVYNCMYICIDACMYTFMCIIVCIYLYIWYICVCAMFIWTAWGFVNLAIQDFLSPDNADWNPKLWLFPCDFPQNIPPLSLSLHMSQLVWRARRHDAKWSAFHTFFPPVLSHWHILTSHLYPIKHICPLM